ncbi:MAG: 50S ribosomal protein L23 [Patescibacteria group bacterium]
MALFDFLKKQKKQTSLDMRQERKSVKPAPEKVELVESKEKPASVPLIPASSFVLISPHVTERARSASQNGQYTFRVKPDATKRTVRESIERFYKVHVTAVQIVKVHEKPRRRGLTEGVKKGYKKAVVALRQGEAIDIF